MKATLALIAALLLVADMAGAGEQHQDDTTCVIMLEQHWQQLTPEEKAGPPYQSYRSYAIYQWDLLREMCLVWYTMQQPKNHGIWLSSGAPNF